LQQQEQQQGNPVSINTLIADYSQNMSLPWFGSNQPGDTYYYTPLIIFIFGVVDVSHLDGDHLYAHVYKEILCYFDKRRQ
jgi:hypothetical protein